MSSTLILLQTDPNLARFAWVVLGAYLVLLLALSYAGYRKSAVSEEDYYLAGRDQGWIVSSLTIMATFFSSFALLGAPGIVYRDGVAFALFALNVPMGAMTVAFVGRRLARLGREHGCVTPADLLGAHYGDSTAVRVMTSLLCFLYVVPYIVMQLEVGGIIAAVWFPDVGPAEMTGKIVLGVITMLYVLIGGMRSVAWTDVIQGTLLLAGMLLAGGATIAALGGPSGFLDSVGSLPPEALTLPGATGSWPIWKMFTICVIASVGSLLQPAQWLRYFAARSERTLERSALIFGTVLPACFLFGVMLVGLGGRALYPPVRDASGALLPHPDVGTAASDFDRILVVVLTHDLPDVFGTIGLAITAVVGVAILAASMSTADSNLHALSAIVTRDVYGRIFRPEASQRERTWFGRTVIVVATLLALGLPALSAATGGFDPLALIAQLGLLAIAFATQLLPATLDTLFFRKGTGAGAISGMIAGLLCVLLFTPLAGLVFDGDGAVLDGVSAIRRQVDIGSFALLANVLIFIAVSALAPKKEPSRGRSSVS